MEIFKNKYFEPLSHVIDWIAAIKLIIADKPTAERNGSIHCVCLDTQPPLTFTRNYFYTN